MEFSEILALFYRRKWLIAIVMTTTIVINSVLLRMQPNLYSVQAMLQVNAQNSGTYSSDALQGMQIFDSFSMGVFFELINGSKLTEQVEKELERRGVGEFAGLWHRDDLKVETKGSEGNGTFLTISYVDSDPEVAEHMLEAAVEAIRAISQDFFEASVQRSRERFESSVMVLHEEIDDIDEKLANIRSIAQLPEDSANVREWVASLHSSKEKLEMRELELAGSLKETELQIKQAVPVAIDDDIDNPLELIPLLEGFPVQQHLMDAADRVIASELKLYQVGAMAGNSQEHPDVKTAQRELEENRKAYAAFLAKDTPANLRVQQAIELRAGHVSKEQKRLAANLVKIQTTLDSVRRLLAEKSRDLDRIREWEAPILQQERDRKAKQTQLTKVQETLDGLVSASQLAPDVVKIFNQVSKPLAIGKFLENYFTVVVLLGVVLSIAMVYGVEMFDHRIHNQHVLRKHTNMQCIGIIPNMNVRNGELPHPRDTSPGTEAFNTILKKILVGLGDGKMLLVSGPDPEAGKTFVSSHIALAASRLGIKTLLVDCDLRQPRVHQVFDIPRCPGLFEWLTGAELLRREVFERRLTAASIDPAQRLRLKPGEVLEMESIGDCELLLESEELGAVRRHTDFPNLTVVPAGSEPDDPASVFNSKELDDFLEFARSEYQFIVLDTPPVNVVSDALLLAERVDGNLLVVKAGRTSSQDLHWARQSLVDVGAPMLGLLLNGLRHRAPGYYSYYYGKKYYRARV